MFSVHIQNKLKHRYRDRETRGGSKREPPELGGYKGVQAVRPGSVAEGGV